MWNTKVQAVLHTPVFGRKKNTLMILSMVCWCRNQYWVSVSSLQGKSCCWVIMCLFFIIVVQFKGNMLLTNKNLSRYIYILCMCILCIFAVYTLNFVHYSQILYYTHIFLFTEMISSSSSSFHGLLHLHVDVIIFMYPFTFSQWDGFFINISLLLF